MGSFNRGPEIGREAVINANIIGLVSDLLYMGICKVGGSGQGL